MKNDVHKAFSAGDFSNAVTLGKKALDVAKTAPEPVRSIELVQIYLNLSTSYMQIKDIQKVEECCDLAVENSRSLQQMNYPKYQDMLYISMSNKAFWLHHLDKSEEAEKICADALAIGDKCMEKKDPRHFKTLRTMGLVKDKLLKSKEAEDYLSKAYNIVVEHSGPAHQDALQVMDEILTMFAKRLEFDTCEGYARKHYNKLVDLGKKNPGYRNEPAYMHVLGEFGARLASLLSQLRRHSEAEVLMRETVNMREKLQGPEHVSVGLGLVAIAQMSEAAGNYSKENDALLARALSIFQSLGPEQEKRVMAVRMQMRRLQDRRNGVHVDDDEDNDDDVHDIPPPRVVTAQGAQKSSSAPSSSGSGKPVSGSSIISSKSKVILNPHDAPTRMRLACDCFEKKEFLEAEILTVEAMNIFAKEKGANDANTKHSKKNLDIVRHHRILQIWEDVSKEMAAQAKENNNEDDGIITTADVKISKGESNSNSINKKSGGAKGGSFDWNNDSTSSMPPGSEWLTQEPVKEGVCRIS